MITELTLEQAAQIPIYRAKWQERMLAMGKVDQQQVLTTIQTAYQHIGQPTPVIKVCGSPQAALTEILRDGQETAYGERLDQQFHQLLGSELESSLACQLSPEVNQRLQQELQQPLTHLYINSGENELSKWLVRQFEAANLAWYVHPASWSGVGASIDFCSTVLNCDCDVEKWQVFQALVQYCGWMFPYQNLCLVCDRPITLLLPLEEYLPDNFSGLLVQFADGFSLSRTSDQEYAASLNG